MSVKGDETCGGSWGIRSQHQGFPHSPRVCWVRRDRRELCPLVPRPHLRSVRTWPNGRTSCQGLAPERLLCSQPIRTSDRALSAPFSAVLTSRSPFPTVGSSPESYAQSPRSVGFQIFTRSDHTDMELVILWEGQQLTEPQELPASSRDWLVGGKAMWPYEVGGSLGLGRVTPQPTPSLLRMQLRLEPGLVIGVAAPHTPPTNALRGSRCSRPPR